MYLMAVNELKTPRKVRETLAAEGEVLVTNNGRPMAVLLDIRPGEDAEEMLEVARDVRSRLALRRVRESSRREGTSRMTSDDINGLILKVRRERRKRA